MDAKSLGIILDNNRDWYTEVFAACVVALEKAEALPGMANYPGEKQGHELAQTLGEAIKAVIWEHAKREYGITEDNAVTLPAMIFSTALGHIPDADLGALAYSGTRERWCDAHGIDPYPEING